ncbi:MAG: 3-carboxymuconate cyclase [Ilumatobacteraceae bacterium]
MFRSRKRIAVGVIAAAAALAFSASTAAAGSAHQPQKAGSVYTLTNATTGNEVVQFDRLADGSLTQQGTYATNGIGTGAGLGSQGALALDGDHLFAVNAASNTISSFDVQGDGLVLESTVPSGGTTPISVTVHGHVLYVLNSGGTANISGFLVAPHRLIALPRSTRQLSVGAAGPAQVSFSPDGSKLVVTEKTSNTIDIFRVILGYAGQPVASGSVGGTPFGFDFDRRGNLLVSNASGSASSYSIGRNGRANVISGAVATGNAAPCWLVATPNSRFAYTANAGAGTLSGFAVGRDGSLTLLAADGISASFGAGSHPLDEIVTSDGQYLYNLTDGLHVINGLRIGNDGTLTQASTSTVVPAGSVGIVAS